MFNVGCSMFKFTCDCPGAKSKQQPLEPARLSSMWFNFKNYPFIGCVMHIGSLPLGPKTDMQGFHVKFNQKNTISKRGAIY